MIRNGTRRLDLDQPGQHGHPPHAADAEAGEAAPDRGAEPAGDPAGGRRPGARGDRPDHRRSPSAGSAKVAGRDAYELVLAPARHGVAGRPGPARDRRRASTCRCGCRSFAQGATSPAFEVGVHPGSFARPDADQFMFNPPPGTKVTEEAAERPTRQAGRRGQRRAGRATGRSAPSATAGPPCWSPARRCRGGAGRAKRGTPGRRAGRRRVRRAARRAADGQRRLGQRPAAHQQAVQRAAHRRRPGAGRRGHPGAALPGRARLTSRRVAPVDPRSARRWARRGRAASPRALRNASAITAWPGRFGWTRSSAQRVAGLTASTRSNAAWVGTCTASNSAASAATTAQYRSVSARCGSPRSGSMRYGSAEDQPAAGGVDGPAQQVAQGALVLVERDGLVRPVAVARARRR